MQIRIERGYPGHHLGRACSSFLTPFIIDAVHNGSCTYLFITNPRGEFHDSGLDHPFSFFLKWKKSTLSGLSIHRLEDRNDAVNNLARDSFHPIYEQSYHLIFHFLIKKLYAQFISIQN